jgi:hypothetical protein
VTAAQFEDREGRDLVEAIHARKGVTEALRTQLAESTPSLTPDQVDQLMTMATDFGKKLREKAAFDYDAPLPDLHIRKARSWEPAARHYRDLTDDERTDHTTGTP